MERIVTDAQREEARRIIAVQASTRPKPDRDGRIDLGPVGAWERARGVRTGTAGPASGHLGDVSLTAETSGMGERQPRRGGRFLWPDTFTS